jgi:tripartite-type tricarboxylate transporter receptor subunit TctC
MAISFQGARRFLVALTLATVVPLVSAQSSYPNRTIQMIVPLAAASAVDNAARILAQRMSQNMGQAIVVENQAGAAGLIGAERVAKAAPDGYTIGGFNDSIMTMLDRKSVV